MQLHQAASGDARTVIACHPGSGAEIADPNPIETGRRAVRLLGAGQDASPPEIADTLAGLIEREGWAPVGVIGWGGGGWAATALAARRPDLVDRLVLIAVPPADNAADLGFDPAAINAKTLLLYGAKDPVLRAPQAKWWKARIADTRIEMVRTAAPLIPMMWGRALSHAAPGSLA